MVAAVVVTSHRRNPEDGDNMITYDAFGMAGKSTVIQ